jgi:ketosteroid isomerase-like protein
VYQTDLTGQQGTTYWSNTKTKIMKRLILFVNTILILVALSCQAGFAQTSTDQAARLQNAPNGKVVMAWYTAWVKKDWNLMQQILADGFTFSSPVDDHIDVKVLKSRCWPNAYNLKRVNIEKFVVSGDDVFVIGTGWTNNGKSLRNMDCFKVKDGKIKAYECFFGPGISFPNSGK